MKKIKITKKKVIKAVWAVVAVIVIFMMVVWSIGIAFM